MNSSDSENAKQLAVVSEIAQVVSASLSIEEVMSVVYDAVAPYLDHKSFSVCRYARSTDSLKLLFGISLGVRTPEWEAPLGGFSSVVIRENRTLSIPSLAHRDPALPDPLLAGLPAPVASWLGVPLHIRGQVFGVLSIGSDVEGAYSEADERLLATLADQIAVAIDNARLFEQTRAQSKRLAVLNRVSRAVSRTLDVDELMEGVHREVESAFDHDGFLVILHDETTHELYLRFGVADGDRLPQGHRRPFGGFTGIVISRRETLHIHNYPEEKQHLPSPYMPEGETQPHDSWLGVPLIVGEHILGAMCLMSDRPNAYDAEKVRLFETLADQVASALVNAELFGSMRSAVDRLGIVNRIGRLVSREHDLEQLGRTIHREIAPVFEADSFFIALLNEDETMIEFPFMVDDGKRTPSDPIPVGHGLTSTVIRTKKMLHIRNGEEYGQAIGTPSLYGSMRTPESWLGIPLIVQNRVIGIINVQSYRPYAYTDDQALLLSTITDQVAMSFEKTRLLLAAQREIQDRKRVEEALRVSEERFALAVAGANEGVWDWNIREDSLYWSPRMKEILGYADDELDVQFETLEELTHPDDMKRTNAAISAHLDSRTPYDIEQRLLSKSGDYVWIRARGQAVWDEEGKPIRMVGSSTDITALKEAEMRLKEERALLRTIIDNIPDFIYAKDLDGDYTVANASLARFFERASGDEMVGKTLACFLGSDLAEKYIEEDRKMLATGETLLNQENHVVDRSTGQPRWFLVSKLPLVDASGDVVGIVGIDRDITARKHAEQEVQRYLAEVEVANEEVKQFAYIVSHDLRSPLVNLKGFSSELHDAMATLRPHLAELIERLEEADRNEVSLLVEEDIPEALGFIETSVSRMDGFINSVLRLSRLGRRELTLQPVDVAQFVETCRQSLAHQMEERSVELTVGDLPEVIADPTALEQIIGNLLTNAVNYLDPARPGRIKVGAQREQLATRFWIKDNGRGIAKEDHEKVFAPFRRAGKQDVVGEGMGLSYVRTMVRQHGGQIWFESEPDVGTTFFFTIANPQEERTT